VLHSAPSDSATHTTGNGRDGCRGSTACGVSSNSARQAQHDNRGEYGSRCSADKTARRVGAHGLPRLGIGASNGGRGGSSRRTPERSGAVGHRALPTTCEKKSFQTLPQTTAAFAPTANIRRVCSIGRSPDRAFAAEVRRAASHRIRLRVASATLGSEDSATTDKTARRVRAHGLPRLGIGAGNGGRERGEPPHSRAERRGGPPRPTYDRGDEAAFQNIADGAPGGRALPMAT
jgi:hypothetical protein